MKIDETKRKLLKLGIYTAPTVVFVGKVRGARASGSKRQGEDIWKKIGDGIEKVVGEDL